MTLAVETCQGKISHKSFKAPVRYYFLQRNAKGIEDTDPQVRQGRTLLNNVSWSLLLHATPGALWVFNLTNTVQVVAQRVVRERVSNRSSFDVAQCSRGLPH